MSFHEQPGGGTRHYNGHVLAQALPAYLGHEVLHRRYKLIRLVAREVYNAWAELVWPGDSIDGWSDQSIVAAYQAALDCGSTDLGTLARAALEALHGPCACVLPEHACPVCRVTGEAVESVLAYVQDSTDADGAA